MKIEYMKFGHGLKTMVFLPGLTLQPISEMPRNFLPDYKIFSEDFTIYLFDYREDLPEGIGLKDLSEDVAEAIFELELNDIYLCGASLGGMMAQYLLIDHPQYFKKAALCSTVCKVGDDNRAFRWMEYAKKKDIISLIDRYMKDVYTEEYYERSIDVMISMYKDLSDVNLKDLIIRLESVKGFDLSDKVQKIGIPCLLVGSKKDKLFTYEEMKMTADKIGCDSYFYEGYFHKVYDEAPDFKEMVYNFYMK